MRLFTLNGKTETSSGVDSIYGVKARSDSRVPQLRENEVPITDNRGVEKFDSIIGEGWVFLDQHLFSLHVGGNEYTFNPVQRENENSFRNFSNSKGNTSIA